MILKAFYHINILKCVLLFEGFLNKPLPSLSGQTLSAPHFRVLSRSNKVQFLSDSNSTALLVFFSDPTLLKGGPQVEEGGCEGSLGRFFWK